MAKQSYIWDGTAWQPMTAPVANSASFKTISTPSGTSPVALTPTDTLTLVAGSGITITGNASTDTITITSTATGGGGDASFSDFLLMGG